MTPIATLRALNAKGEPLYAGYAARIQGIVTAAAAFGAGTNDDYVDDGTGAINVYRSTNGISPFTPTTTGQTSKRVGHIGFNGGRLRLDLTDSVEKTVVAVGIRRLLADPSRADAARVDDRRHSTRPPSCSKASWSRSPTSSIVERHDSRRRRSRSTRSSTVGDGTGSFSLKIDHDTDVEGFTPPSIFTLIGIVQQDDFLRPFDSATTSRRAAASISARPRRRRRRC